MFDLWEPPKPAVIIPAPKELLPPPMLGLTMMARTWAMRARRAAVAASGITIVGVFENSSSGSAVNVALSGTAAGDVVYAFAGASGSESYPSGYTGLASLDPYSDTSARFNISRKILTGADTTTAFPANPIPGTYSLACGCMVLRGVSNSTPEDATITTTTGSGGGQPDSPSITTATANALVISCFIAIVSADDTYTAPSGYGDKIDIYGAGATYTFGIGVASVLAGAAGAYNPGAWSGVTYGFDSTYSAATIAVRPA